MVGTPVVSDVQVNTSLQWIVPHVAASL